MEKKFPGAGKTETGGTKMISPWLISCDASLSNNGAQWNAIEQIKKDRFSFYRRILRRICSPTAGRNRFDRRKNRSNSADIRLVSNRRNGRVNGPLVTTNHLLLPSQRGKAAFSLPISQPNSDFSAVSAMGELRGRGGQPDASGQIPLIDKLAQKIYYKGAPTLPLSLKKTTSVHCVRVG